MSNEMTGRTVVGPSGIVGDVYGGTDERAPLVLLHGLSYDRRIWDPVLRELQDPGRHVLVIDLPGHGASEDPWAWQLADAATALHGVICEQDMDEPVVVGHSAGAVLAVAYAAQYPTNGVVNVDAVLRTEEFGAMLRAVAGALRGSGFEDIWSMIAAGFGIEQLPEQAQRLVRSYGPPRQEVALGFWGDLIDRTPEESTEFMDAILDNVRRGGAPYHEVNGTPRPDYERWLRYRLPDATMEVVTGGGHFPMLADPVRFARLLADTGRWHRDLRRSEARAG